MGDREIACSLLAEVCRLCVARPALLNLFMFMVERLVAGTLETVGQTRSSVVAAVRPR